MVPQGSSFDLTLQNSGTLDAGALRGDAQLNDDQIDDLTQAGYRGEYGDTDLGDQNANSRGSQHAIHPGNWSKGDTGEQQYPDAADPVDPDQGRDSGVAGSGV